MEKRSIREKVEVLFKKDSVYLFILDKERESECGPVGREAEGVGSEEEEWGQRGVGEGSWAKGVR